MAFTGRETTFLAVRCFNCRMCQVIQANKKKRFCCKICSSQQTIQSVVQQSTSAAELRHVVQALNASLGEKATLPLAPEQLRAMPDHGTRDARATANVAQDAAIQMSPEVDDYHQPYSLSLDRQVHTTSFSSQEMGDTNHESIVECSWASRQETQFPQVLPHVSVGPSNLPSTSDWIDDESPIDGWQGVEELSTTAVRQKQHEPPPSRQEEPHNGARRGRWNSSKGLWTERHSRAMA